ncbi:MAG TPA: LysM domain-containing protein, partial [Chloroflexota bacterium]|nr:LysM domain-containing protein [Chloroflexota bacterium]
MARNKRARRRVARATRGDRLRLFLPGRSWRFQLVAIAAAIAAAILASQSFASATPAAATYVIQPGDTLLAIAATTGVPLDRITNLNGLKNPDMIIAGQTLQLQG